MKTAWEAEDRQGVKRFAERPKFHALHGIFIGKPASYKHKPTRIIRQFTATVINGEILGYPKTVKVQPRR